VSASLENAHSEGKASFMGILAGSYRSKSLLVNLTKEMAVDAVWGEPLSGAIRLLTGKNTGNLRLFFYQTLMNQPKSTRNKAAMEFRNRQQQGNIRQF
jgi:hypothetical protein